jgi:monovalent cation:H+ antiporter-2, CPA2 family
MFLTPLISGLTAPIYRLWRRHFQREIVQTIHLPQDGLRDHIIIAGGGRLGSYLAQVMQKLGFSFVIIEQDYRRMEEAKNAGFPVIYGDASQEPVLAAAMPRLARLALITVPNIFSSIGIIRYLKLANPSLHLIVRANDSSQLEQLTDEGVYEIIQPEFEATLEFTRQTLLHLRYSMPYIQRFTDELRRDQNLLIQREDLDDIRTLNLMGQWSNHLDIEWIEIQKGHPLAGLLLKDSKVRVKTGAMIVAVLRQDELLPNPGADFQILAGDYLALMGRPEQLSRYREVCSDI